MGACRSYRQFCPIAKASRDFRHPWLPLIVRELMAGVHSFPTSIAAVPLISRARPGRAAGELEDHGVH